MRSVFAILLLSALAVQAQDDAKSKVMNMVAKVGGMDALHGKKDVTYTYLYEHPSNGRDVSTETYVFDGEKSHAVYTEAKNMGMDGKKVVQGYNGKTAWVTVDGVAVTEGQGLRMADFLRKTNYYWFAMFHKLGDPGLTYVDKGKRTVDGIEYHIVEVGFESGVGDVQDTYLLYINPYTGLADQFLFTVEDFGLKDPLMMRVTYETIEGVTLPTVRKYTPSNWDGDIPADAPWILEIMQDIRFNTGVPASLFEKP